MYLITIDSGTTNTRVNVWEGKEVKACVFESIGVRDVAKKNNNNILIDSVKKLLESALKRAGITSEQVDAIVASGMITSDLGLCHIPHLKAPVGIEQLAENAVMKIIPEITHLPIWFIPGIKNTVENLTLENCDAMDMMRGEEVEVLGVLEECKINTPTLIVLPGSHSKLVKIDENQRIIGCVTTMAGELLDVFTHQTVLANSLRKGFAQHIDDDYLFQGADMCKKVGITRAAFTVRILDIFTDASDDQRASFLLGAVLYADIATMKHSVALNLSSETAIVISGKPILQEALEKLIQRDSFFSGEIMTVSGKNGQSLSGIGALAVMQSIQTKQDKAQQNEMAH